MTYTVQFWVPGFANPDDTRVRHFNSKRAIGYALENYQETAENLGSEGSCEALVWVGHFVNVAGLEPDYQVTIGPRGGINFNRL